MGSTVQERQLLTVKGYTRGGLYQGLRSPEVGWGQPLAITCRDRERHSPGWA